MTDCPHCDQPKAAKDYLCRGCWFTLRPETRRALNRRDALAVRRLSDLHERLREGVALHLIEVTA